MPSLELIYSRRYFGTVDQGTAGELLYGSEQDGVSFLKHICFGLEDFDRGDDLATKKVPGKTAIPCGRYEVVIDWSPKFQCMMPHILGVPFFSGIRAHSGVHAGHTDGCLLVSHIFDIATWKIDRSKVAYEKVYEIIEQSILRGSKVFITYRRER